DSLCLLVRSLRQPTACHYQATHRVTSEAASCPHAPSISRPRVSRTVVATPASRRRRTNSRSTGLGLASHLLPGVGLSGIRFTWASLPCSSLPSRSARQG